MTRVRVSVRVSVCPPQPSLRPSVERYLRERPEVAMLLRGLLRCDPQTRPHPHSNPDPPLHPDPIPNSAPRCLPVPPLVPIPQPTGWFPHTAMLWTAPPNLVPKIPRSFWTPIPSPQPPKLHLGSPSNPHCLLG